MKQLVRFLWLLLVSWQTGSAQSISNPGFEVALDTNQLLPQGWKVDQKAGYTISLDNTVVKQGQRSLLIASVAPAPTVSAGISQTCTVQLSEPTLVHLRGFIKTDNPAGVGIWWNSWKNWTHQGFVHSNQQLVLRQTTEWQPLDLVLPASPQVNQFTFGAYLNAPGHVWLDELRMETTTGGPGEPSAQVKAYVQNVMALVKKHALVRDSISWPQTQAEMMAYARGLQTPAQTYPLIGYLLNQMRQYGDHHSFFLSPQAVTHLEANQPVEEGGREPQPVARYLGNGLGYVAVPRFWGSNKLRETAFATHLQQLIRQLDSSYTVSSWVVDLRGNTGGNVLPMVTGLEPLYGKNAQRTYKRWTAKRGTRVPHAYRLRKFPERLAVLLDSKTASSGEFTALTFIGLPNVRTFGQHSAGYTTGNTDYKLSDGAMLFIAGTVGENRVGKKYPKGIVPDETIQAVSTADSDPTLEAAQRWLQTR